MTTANRIEACSNAVLDLLLTSPERKMADHLNVLGAILMGSQFRALNVHDVKLICFDKHGQDNHNHHRKTRSHSWAVVCFWNPKLVPFPPNSSVVPALLDVIPVEPACVQHGMIGFSFASGREEELLPPYVGIVPELDRETEHQCPEAALVSLIGYLRHKKSRRLGIS